MFYTPPESNPNDPEPPSAQPSGGIGWDYDSTIFSFLRSDDQAYSYASDTNQYAFGSQHIADGFFSLGQLQWLVPGTPHREDQTYDLYPVLNCVPVRDWGLYSLIPFDPQRGEPGLDWSAYVRLYLSRATSSASLASHWADVAPLFGQPGDQEVMYGIELAGGLTLAVSESGRWWNRPYPVTRNGRTELWHATLLPTGQDPLIARAVSSSDFGGPPFRQGLAMSVGQRYSLVMLSSALHYHSWDETTSATPFLPHQVCVEYAAMSRLGTTLAWTANLTASDTGPASGASDQPDAAYAGLKALVNKEQADLAKQEPMDAFSWADLLQVTQRIHLGRDVSMSVREVDMLMPFGHRVQRSESFMRDLDGQGRAALSELPNAFVIVDRSVELSYDATRGAIQPFVRVDIVPTTIPELSPVDTSEGMRWCTSDGNPYQLALRGVDSVGNVVHFSVPFALTIDTSTPEPILVSLDGQRLAYQQRTDGSATLPTTAITLDLAVTPGQRPQATIASADVMHPTLHAMGAASAITLTPRAGDVYATFPSVTIGSMSSTGLPTSQLGTVTRVAVPVNALHASQGLVPAAGATDLAPHLPGGALELFALFDLSTLPLGPPAITTTTGSDGSRVVTFVYSAGKAGPNDPPPTLSSGFAAATFDALSLTLTMTSGPSGSTRTLKAHCDTLTLSLTPPEQDTSDPDSAQMGTGISLPLNQLDFTANAGMKPSMSAELGDLRFMGHLDFLNPILECLPLDLFSNPPALSVTDTGALLGYDLQLPDLPFGVFDLTGLGVQAQLSLPFTGDDPSFTFAIPGDCRQFGVYVVGLGGFGAFSLTVSSSNVHLHAELGFGGILALNLVVISGSIQASGGITIDHDSSTGALDVGGYVEIVGSVNVLDVASATIGAKVDLHYTSSPRSVVGEGEIWVCVDVLLLSFSQYVPYSVQFSGGDDSDSLAAVMPRVGIHDGSRASSITPPGQGNSSADMPPHFTDAVSEADWAQYCAAFASAPQEIVS